MRVRELRESGNPGKCVLEALSAGKSQDGPDGEIPLEAALEIVRKIAEKLEE